MLNNSEDEPNGIVKRLEKPWEITQFTSQREVTQALYTDLGKPNHPEISAGMSL